MENFFVYILYSKSANRYYIGQTNNIVDRLKRHNLGQVGSTKSYVPWELHFSLEVPTRKDAVKVERYLKNLKSRARIENWIHRKENL